VVGRRGVAVGGRAVRLPGGGRGRVAQGAWAAAGGSPEVEVVDHRVGPGIGLVIGLMDFVFSKLLIDVLGRAFG